MASFESKVSQIFDENLQLSRYIPPVIRVIFDESEAQFRKRMYKNPDDVEPNIMALFDLLFINFYFEELNGTFMNWVIREFPERFTKTELEEMNAQSVSHIDFYEIQEAIPGQGSLIKSITTDKEIFLYDIASSKHFVKWDIVMLRCYKFKDKHFATGGMSIFRPMHKKWIQDQMMESFNDWMNTQENGVDFSDFARERYDVFFSLKRKLNSESQNKKIYSSFGELQLCEVRFQVRNLDTLLSELEALDEFNFIESKIRSDKKKRKNITRYQFAWFAFGDEEDLNALRTTSMQDGFMLMTEQLDINGKPMGTEVIGTLYVDKYLGRLETQSIELAEYASRHFPEVSKGKLTYKRIIKLKQDKLSDGGLLENQQGTADFRLENKDLVDRVEREYYLSILDQQIPMLNGKTPREAAGEPALRPLLIEWLKELENTVERNRRSGDRSFSIAIYKKELDLNW